MSTRGFSRRDLLHLGGKLVMSIGAAKVVIALPGCGGDGGSVDAPTGIDASPDAYDYYAHLSLDDCHAIGTYDYQQYYPGPNPYTYHYYFTGAYGCPYIYDAYLPPGVYCYPDYGDFDPGYSYFCFSGYYETVTFP